MFKLLSKRMLKDYSLKIYYVYKKLYNIEILSNDGKVISVLNNWKECFIDVSELTLSEMLLLKNSEDKINELEELINSKLSGLTVSIILKDISGNDIFR